MNSPKPNKQIIRLQTLLYLTTLFALFYVPVKGQEKPPKPIAVTISTIRHLNFGTFIVSGAGGTVTVDYNGIRTATNDIYLPSLNSAPIPTPALFEVTALSGTLITISNGSPTSLSGSHGGSMILTLGSSSTGSPFVARSTTTEVSIGGTLTVGNLGANPVGNYEGIFTITFMQN